MLRNPTDSFYFLCKVIDLSVVFLIHKLLNIVYLRCINPALPLKMRIHRISNLTDVLQRLKILLHQDLNGYHGYMALEEDVDAHAPQQ